MVVKNLQDSERTTERRKSALFLRPLLNPAGRHNCMPRVERRATTRVNSLKKSFPLSVRMERGIKRVRSSRAQSDQDAVPLGEGSAARDRSWLSRMLFVSVCRRMRWFNFAQTMNGNTIQRSAGIKLKVFISSIATRALEAKSGTLGFA